MPSYHLEERLEDYVIDHCGIHSIKLDVSGHNGHPDRLFFIPGGRPLLIEFKRPGEEVEPGSVQEYVIESLVKLGYNVQTHDSAEEALAAIQKAVEEARE